MPARGSSRDVGVARRRTQFSSCDECRRSRVGCDALSQGTRDDEPGACTRCQNRNKQCTFKWMKDIKGAGPKKVPLGKRKQRHHSITSSTTDGAASRDAGALGSPTPKAGTADSILSMVDWAAIGGPASLPHDDRCRTASLIAPSPADTTSTAYSLEPTGLVSRASLQIIYDRGFDAVFGSWMGRHGCPFLLGENSLAEKHASIAAICSRLDAWMTDASDDEPVPMMDKRQQSPRDRLIDDSLQNTIAAFSARWLPLTSSKTDPDQCHRNAIHALWRHARRDMLRVINRPSYRSMLALFLFALTPIPAGIHEDEEVDGISGQACVHAALQQIQTLRARQRNLQFSGSKVSPSMKSKAICASPESIGTSDFIAAESIAYWAALTFDTSASLTLNCRSLLSSGLFGFEAELPWRLVRTGAKMFEETTHDWRAGGLLEMTDDRANQIIANGTSWKLLAWKLTAVFKEALRDGHDESEVLKGYRRVTESMQHFNDTYRQPLEQCQRRMQFLEQQTKLRWYSLMLHYHLSILMLEDIIEATGRYDLLPGLSTATADAENAVMNTLVFGLHNTFTLSFKNSFVGSPGDADGDSTDAVITVPLISMDPYPHHVVASVQLMRKAIDRHLAMGKISVESHTSLQATLEQTLSQLPQSSKSVQAARNRFSLKGPSDGAGLHQDPYVDLQAQYAE